MTRSCRHQPSTTRVLDTPWGALVVPDTRDWYVDGGLCEYRRCVEFDCPVCGCMRGGWGPMDCPCDDLHGYREMRRKRAVAVKPSVRGRSHVSRARARKGSLK